MTSRGESAARRRGESCEASAEEEVHLVCRDEARASAIVQDVGPGCCERAPDGEDGSLAHRLPLRLPVQPITQCSP